MEIVIYALVAIDMLGLVALAVWACEPWKRSVTGHHLEP